MKINDEQEKILDSYKCVRISSDYKYDDYTLDFCNKRNNVIVAQLQNEAIKEDKDGEIAHYIIVHDEQIVLYFALKTGSVYTPLQQDLQQIKLQLLYNLKKNYGFEIIDNIDNCVELALQQDGSSIHAKKLLCDYKQYEDLKEDTLKEAEALVVQVQKTYSGIELVNFCANDNARNAWNKHEFLHTMGAVLFWKHIVPIVCDIRNLVGCKYFFLFAADTTADGTLVNYYSTVLPFVKFSELDGLSINKPLYDLTCTTMCCDTAQLKTYRDEFFNNFNPDPTDDFV